MKINAIRTFVSAAAIYAVAGTTAFAQGIPVYDNANVVQAIAQVAAWGKQYQQMIDQINQLQQQYSSMTGSRNLGQIFNDPALKDYLPANWQSVYDAVKSGGYSGLTGTALTEYNNNKIFDACASIKDETQKNTCEAAAVKPSQDKGMALDAFTKAKSRLDQINKLMTQINATNDPKSIAELQARIASEQAMIQNEATKMQLYQMVAQAETQVQQQRQHELNSKDRARRGWPNLPTSTSATDQ